MKDKIHKYEGFKILSLSVIEHGILGTNTFNFVDESDVPNSIYFSVMIGPNGTGKSEVLRLIITLFRNICRLEQNKLAINVSGWFELTYSSFGCIYSFTNIPLEYRMDKAMGKLPDKKSKPYLIENEDTDKYFDFQNASKTLPVSIVANSIMLTDKFFVPRNEDEEKEFPMYKYLGVRMRPQQASTRYYIRKTIEFIVEQINSDAFNDGIKRITKFLAGEQSINVLFYTAYTSKFFNGNLTKTDLDTYFDPILERYENSEIYAPFKATHYDKMRKDESYIHELCAFVNGLKNTDRLEHQDYSSVKIIRYNVGDSDSHNLLKKEYKFLDDLRKLGLVKAPDVTMVAEKEVNIQDTSSGEFHFFSTMVGLMATIKPNSVILIDVPEISLHPNWQMKYVHFLRELFSSDEYKTCQIIIATHSHFLVSDLKGGSSNIIGLKRIENKISTIDLSGINTFGWSAEQVLLDVFDVPTTRNYYIADRFSKIMKQASLGGINSIGDYKDELLEWENSLSDEDPIKYAISKLIEKTEWRD